MNREEIVEQIRALYNKAYEAETPSSLEYAVKQILDLLAIGSKLETGAGEFQQAADALFHTQGKEVSYADSYYSKSHLKSYNGARKKEFEESMATAKNQIHTDLMFVLMRDI